MSDAKADAAGLPYVVKQPWEEVTYDFDFAPLLRTDETLVDVISVTGEAGVTVSAVAMESPFVQARIAGGVDGTDYKVTARAVTSSGDRRECEGELRVRDI